MSKHFDAIILGAGQAGPSLAGRLTAAGQRVAFVERKLFGGTCVNTGCIPTKALLHAAEIADSTRESEKFGIRATFEGIEMPAVLSYQQGVVDRLWKGLQSTIAARKIDTIAGEGRLASANSVVVGDATYTGDYIVLATGSVPRSLPGLSIDGSRVISSDEGLALDRVPKSAIILGGGVIGVEFASVWRSFGADVTIVEMAPQLLPLEDEASAKVLQRVFRRRGIAFELGTPFQSVSYTDDGVSVTLGNGKVLAAEILLVAVGRVPGGRPGALLPSRRSRAGYRGDRPGQGCLRDVPGAPSVPAVRTGHASDTRGVGRHDRGRAPAAPAPRAGPAGPDEARTRARPLRMIGRLICGYT